MAGGALVLAAWFGWRGLRLLPRGAAEWRAVVVLGAPNILGWHALAIIGVAHLPAGRAAILGFTMPVWAVLLGVLFYGSALPRGWRWRWAPCWPASRCCCGTSWAT
jgi:drug/metabolite transporter (DMT)-like permease